MPPQKWFIQHESMLKPSGQECETGLYPKIRVGHRSDNSGQPSGGIPDQLPDPVEHGLGKGGSTFRRGNLVTGGEGDQAAQKVIGQFPKPSPPAPQGGFITRYAKGWITAHGCFNTFSYVTLVRHQEVRQFVVNAMTHNATQAADYQDDSNPEAVNANPFAAADYL